MKATRIGRAGFLCAVCWLSHEGMALATPEATGRVETGGAHSAAEDPIGAAWHANDDGYRPPPSSEPRPDASNHADHVDADRVTTRKDGMKRRYAIEANPSAAILGRYSAQLEYMVMPRHSLILNPAFEHRSIDETIARGSPSIPFSFTGGAFEVGYHYFYYGTHDGADGPSGLYVGLAALSHYTKVSVSGANGQDNSFWTFGAAAELGGQFVIEPGIVLGVGFGVQYQANTDNFAKLANNDIPAFAWHGVAPRFLSSIGYAF